MRAEFLRLPLYAMLALAACGSSTPQEKDPAIAWLADQYFGDGQTVELPKLMDISTTISPQIRIWRPESRVAQGADLHDVEFISEYELISAYYPFLHGGGSGEYPKAYRKNEVSFILDTNIARVNDTAARLTTPFNLFSINAVNADEIARLRAGASARRLNVTHATPDCLVIAYRSRDHADQRNTEVYMGSKSGRWDLNDPAIERCTLAGLLQALGANVAYTMKRADDLYPHVSSSRPCTLAMLGAGARLERPMHNFGCLSRAKSDWPFTLLRRAFATGKLKAGSIRKDQFVEALDETARELGPDLRSKVISKEQARFAGADRPYPQNSTVVTQ